MYRKSQHLKHWKFYVDSIFFSRVLIFGCWLFILHLYTHTDKTADCLQRFLVKRVLFPSQVLLFHHLRVSPPGNFSLASSSHPDTYHLLLPTGEKSAIFCTEKRLENIHWQTHLQARYSLQHPQQSLLTAKKVRLSGTGALCAEQKWHRRKAFLFVCTLL